MDPLARRRTWPSSLLRNLLRSGLLGGSLLLGLLAGLRPAVAQPGEVTVTLTMPPYELVYLAEIVEAVQRDYPAILPDVSWEVTTTAPSATVFIRAQAYVQLSGARDFELLAERDTRDLEVPGHAIFGPGSLSADTGVAVRFYENRPLLDKMKDHALRLPTAPAGRYRLVIQVYDAHAREHLLASDEATIEIRYADVSEAFVTLIDPGIDAELLTILPTFSWVMADPNATTRLYVYERRPEHGSCDEAILETPHLDVELTGVTSYQFPANPSRLLLPGTAYCWYVEALVRSNRGVEAQRSEIRAFHVRLDDALLTALVDLIASMGGDLAALLSDLLAEGWTPDGEIWVDGQPVTFAEFVVVLERLRASRAPLLLDVRTGGP